jgi:hypothetical protein
VEINPFAMTGPDSGNAIALDAAGNAFVTGSYWNGADTDVFVALFDPLCNLVNFCQISNPGPDSGNGIALDNSGHVYVTGSYCVAGLPQAFLAVFDLSCNMQCISFIPSVGPGSGNAVAVDPAGNAFVTGSLNNGAMTNAFVTNFDPSCTQICPTVLIPGGGQDSGNGVAVDFNGNAYLTGSVLTGAGTINIFVAKYDNACSPICMFTVNGPGPDSGNAISLDVGGNAYITGVYVFPEGSSSAFLAKFDPNCGPLCRPIPVPFPVGPGSIGRGIAVNVDGFGYLIGSFLNAGATNAFTATFFPSCEFNCVAGLPSGGGPDSGNAVVMDGQGLGYLTGSFFTGAFTNAFVTKVDPACNPQCPIIILPNPN